MRDIIQYGEFRCKIRNSERFDETRTTKGEYKVEKIVFNRIINLDFPR